jgi:DNA-binding LytR/AlgR family response regulator
MVNSKINKINIAVCDDDPAFRETLALRLNMYAGSHDMDASVLSFSNGLELMISEVKYDLIFLDYKMGIMNGLETAKKLRKKGLRCPIIFVTSFNEIVYDVFEVNAFRFLTKPVESEALERAMDDFLALYKNSRVINFVSNGNAVSLVSSDITYVEGKGRGCIVHTDTEAYPVLQSLSMFSEGLPEHFFRSHRNFNVNLGSVGEVEQGLIRMKNGASVKLDKSRHTALKIALDGFGKP